MSTFLRDKHDVTKAIENHIDQLDHQIKYTNNDEYKAELFKAKSMALQAIANLRK
jgi:6-pyruvoyl-tetrahydropterin synthase